MIVIVLPLTAAVAIVPSSDVTLIAPSLSVVTVTVPSLPSVISISVSLGVSVGIVFAETITLIVSLIGLYVLDAAIESVITALPAESELIVIMLLLTDAVAIVSSLELTLITPSMSVVNVTAPDLLTVRFIFVSLSVNVGVAKLS